MNDTLYDLIIIGAGPAGMTAAIYAARANKNVVLIDKNGFGGNIAKSPKVENIPGFTEISGVDFAANMFNQIENLQNITHIIDEAVFVDYKYGMFKISLFDDHRIICGKSLIFATGTEHRELNIDPDNTYYCATCDGPFFKGKDVIVVGSGNSGATYALELATYCRKVYLCDITSDMCCEKIIADRVKSCNNIEWLANTTITTVEKNKNNKLTAVILTNGEKLKCSAIFGAIGLIPKTEIAKRFVKTDDRGFIISDDCTTSLVPGVFVAGDCRTNKVKQVVTACADGATAAIAAIDFLNNMR